MKWLASFTGLLLASLLSYPLWIAGIPFLFLIFGRQHEDRLIGELSYPIYLVHVTVIKPVEPIMWNLTNRRWLGITAALISVAVSVVLYVLLIVPIDKKRHALARSLGADV